jgi:hypothetical protein
MMINYNQNSSSPKRVKCESPSIFLGTPKEYGTGKFMDMMSNISGSKLPSNLLHSPYNIFSTKHSRNLESSFMKMYEGGGASGSTIPNHLNSSASH